VQDPLADVEGFDWDEGNIGKNWRKHHVTDWECEEIFFNRPLVVGSDQKYSGSESRYYALGQTDRQRPLFVAFTIRNRRIRPISFREMSSREQRAYEDTKESPGIQE
jgi:hypothetical protein